MKIYRYIAIVMFFLLTGIIGLYSYNSIRLNNSLDEWISLGKPPGEAIQVLGPGFVQTETGDVYEYANKQNCIDDCWVKSKRPSGLWFLPLDNCINSPPLDKFVHSMSFCMYSDSGISLEVYAIDRSGFAYYWSYMHKEFDLPAYQIPFVGVIVGFLFSLPFLVVMLFYDLFDWLKRAQQRE